MSSSSEEWVKRSSFSLIFKEIFFCRILANKKIVIISQLNGFAWATKLKKKRVLDKNRSGRSLERPERAPSFLLRMGLSRYDFFTWFGRFSSEFIVNIFFYLFCYCSKNFKSQIEDGGLLLTHACSELIHIWD